MPRGGVNLARGPIRPTPPNGEPPPFLPGSNVADPRYALRKHAYDQRQEEEHRRNQALDQERASFIGNANNRVNFGMSFTDPRTGLRMDYGGRGMGGGGGAGDDVDFTSAWNATGVMKPPPPKPLPPRVKPIAMEDRRAAEAATFAKAKDAIGRTGRASLNALAGEMRGRGISGSGIHARAIGDRIGGLAGRLGDVSLTQAIESLKREAEITDRNYAGDLSQRGQDIGYNESLNNRAMSVLNARGGMTQALLNLLQRNGGRLY